MPQGIRTISFSGINCYLIQTHDGFMLFDTGYSKNRVDIENQLERTGCQPGNLKLILLSHGDPDHAGNCAYLRKKFGAKIAMHNGDSGMVERGDMLWNRRVNIFIRVIGRTLSSLLSVGLSKSDRFRPDLYIEEGRDLSEYGFDAEVLHIPGHSDGSLGILTADSDLYCGDLFMNVNKPCFSSVYVDQSVANASVEKLKKLSINTVYPGHGKPFQWEQFLKNNR